MTSADIRWLIAILFMGFIAYVVLADIKKRYSSRSPRRPRRSRGFRPDRLTRDQTPVSSWKTGTRRG